ncbi:MAG: potassium channel protein [Candidatus Glassbacteria bacterium]|nr:potassium channel protein [Candidatus Glassbacteria bacterium]
MQKLMEYLRHLFWQERAQLRETAKVYVVILVCLASVVLIFGAVYYFLTRFYGVEKSLVECFYFVWITFSTIGYTDEGFTSGSLIRAFTILVGAYLITRYIVLSAHVYARIVVEEVYKLRVVEQMKKQLKQAEGHFLIFGDDKELVNKIIQGLLKRGVEVYFVSEDEGLVEEFSQMYKNLKYIKTKVFKEDTLDMLRPEDASNAYLLYVEDEKNILLAALLKGRIQVISRFSGDFAAVPRFEWVGVQPISPHFSGGLKMVSTMIRPKVTEFLDKFVFPERALLEFRKVPAGEEQEAGIQRVPLCGIVNGKMDFNLPPNPENEMLAISFRDPLTANRKLGKLSAADLPVRTDKFLILGAGLIGATVLGEARATRREVMIIEPNEKKIEAMRAIHGEMGITYVVGDGTSVEYDVNQFDGVAIATPVDEKNFTIGLDFADTRVHRVVRAIDDDMDLHYRKIGAIPVFVGQVGSERMLREVTNKFANEVLLRMLQQFWRMDQAFITRPGSMAELKELYTGRIIALCRDNTCYFGVEDNESLQWGDTLLICGHVDENRKLRIYHRQEE